MKKFIVFLSVLFIASPFAFSQVYELEYMITLSIEPGNPYLRSDIDRLKMHSSDDKSVTEFIQFSENKYLNGEIFQFPYVIKISFVDGKPYCFAVKDFAPPIPRQSHEIHQSKESPKLNI